MKDLVEALKDPEIYPHHPSQVQFIQTHISYVFLTGGFVYKVKKPVNFGFLDFSTLDKRRLCCQKELELNRRLCQDIYLDVVKVCRDKDGHINLRGKGEVIDYAVLMKELPHQQMMDELLARNQVKEEDIIRIAKVIAAFHAFAKTNEKISQFGDLSIIKKDTDENFAQTESVIGLTISKKDYRQIKSYTDNFLRENKDLFDRRIADRKIRDCHGDLHSRNICLGKDKVYIYDCIEFNRRFRFGDVASEVAFLAMDLDFNKKEDLSNLFVATYIEETQDEELPLLLNFYKCYRAYVRGKVADFLLFEGVQERKSVINLASSYFKLALSYTLKPALIITSGLIGSGKSFLAEKLSGELSCRLLSSDKIRKGLAGIPLTTPKFEEYGRGIYSTDFTQRTYEALFRKAKQNLINGRRVIIDASFSRREEREMARQLAGEMGVEFYLIETKCSQEEIKRRLGQRHKGPSVSDGRLEIYRKQRLDFEEIDEIPARSHIVVETTKAEDLVVRHIKDSLSFSSCKPTG